MTRLSVPSLPCVCSINVYLRFGNEGQKANDGESCLLPSLCVALSEPKDTPPVLCLLIGSPLHVHFYDWLTALTMFTSPRFIKTRVFTKHVIVRRILKLYSVMSNHVPV